VVLGLHDPALHGAADVRLERVALNPGKELREQCGVDPVRAVAACTCRADEVEEMRDRRSGLARVDDERMIVDKPAHRDLAAVPLD